MNSQTIRMSTSVAHVGRPSGVLAVVIAGCFSAARVLLNVYHWSTALQFKCLLSTGCANERCRCTAKIFITDAAFVSFVSVYPVIENIDFLKCSRWWIFKSYLL